MPLIKGKLYRITPYSEQRFLSERKMIVRIIYKYGIGDLDEHGMLIDYSASDTGTEQVGHVNDDSIVMVVDQTNNTRSSGSVEVKILLGEKIGWINYGANKDWELVQ